MRSECLQGTVVQHLRAHEGQRDSRRCRTAARAARGHGLPGGSEAAPFPEHRRPRCSGPSGSTTSDSRRRGSSLRAPGQQPLPVTRQPSRYRLRSLPVPPGISGALSTTSAGCSPGCRERPRASPPLQARPVFSRPSQAALALPRLVELRPGGLCCSCSVRKAEGTGRAASARALHGGNKARDAQRTGARKTTRAPKPRGLLGASLRGGVFE